MKMKHIWGLTFICAFASCSDNVKTTVRADYVISDSKSLKSPYDTLDNLEIPLTLTPDIWESMLEKHIQKYRIENQENWTLLNHPYAKLVEAKNFKAIIYYSNNETSSPAIVTLGQNGNVIDTLILLGEYGGNDPSINITEFVKINNDLSIQLIDSASTYEVDNAGNRIESSLELKVKNELYKILKTGKIQKKQ